MTKLSVETRRRDLKCVRLIEGELDIEHGAHLPAEPLAIIDVDRFVALVAFGTDISRWPVDDDPNNPPDRLTLQLNVEYFQPMVVSNAIGDRPDLTQSIFLNHGEHYFVQRPEKQKVGTTPTFAGLGSDVPMQI